MKSPTARSVIIAVVLFLVFAIPTVILGIQYYLSFYNSLTDSISIHVQTLEELSANAMALQLQKLINLDLKYAAQPALQQAMAAGAWSQAIGIVKDLQNDPTYYDYYIDRVFLIGTDGKINEAFPGIAANDIGTIDSGYTIWGPLIINGNKTSYVSNVVLRSVSPRINVVKIIVPVMNGSGTVGAIRFDIPANEFSDLGKNADLTSNGFVYFVDAKGQIVAHPKISSAWPIESFASVPSVSRAINGQHGVAVLYNPIEQQTRLTAYGQVPGYHWGVIAQEPADEAFSIRNGITDRILLMTIITLIIEAGIAFAVFRREKNHTR